MKYMLTDVRAMWQNLLDMQRHTEKACLKQDGRDR